MPVISVRVPRGVRDLGVTEVGVIVGNRGCQIEAVLGGGSRFGLRAAYDGLSRRVDGRVDGRVHGHVDAGSVLVGKVVVEVGARILRSRVEGLAITGTGTGTVVEDSHMGPYTSIGLDHGRPGDVYNIGGGNKSPNLVLTEKPLELTGAGKKMIRRGPDRKAHSLRYSIDESEIREQLGFEESLAETAAWRPDNPGCWKAVKHGASCAA